MPFLNFMVTTVARGWVKDVGGSSFKPQQEKKNTEKKKLLNKKFITVSRTKFVMFCSAMRVRGKNKKYKEYTSNVYVSKREKSKQENKALLLSRTLDL